MFAGQDYMPPDEEAENETFYYISTVPNGSTDDAALAASAELDTKLYVFAENDTEHWIAANDDGGIEGYATVKIRLVNEQTYYVKLTDLNGAPGAYSVRVTTSSFSGDDEEGPVSDPDSFENDDTPATAKDIPLETYQQRTFERDNVDWVKIVVPPPS